jgi:hypothetical protein
MTISQAQYVDLLVKKLYGVATTDNATNKSPSNESIPSPALNRGDTAWTQANEIPSDSSNIGGIAFQYGNSNPIQCVPDTTTVPLINNLSESIYPTWLTDVTEWITPDFGGGYTIGVYVGPPNIANLTGANVTFISSSGEGGSEPGEFFFDYQAGLLYFIGETIPNVLTSGNVVYVTGYQYNGLTGVTNLPSDTNIGNINIVDTTISSTDANLITFYGNAGVVLPSGNSSQRPGNANVGTIRFNTTIDSLETWDGAQWVTGGNTVTPGTITDQQITPDGSSNTYSLTQTSTSQGILVSINGVTQLPNIAYSVTGNGNSITFTQTPLTQDLIDIRYISYATTISALTNSSGNASVTVTPQGNILFTTNGNIVTTMSANRVAVSGQLSASGNITTSGFFVGAFAGSVSGNVVAPGANTQVIYNSNNLLGASAGFTFDSASNVLTVSGNINSSGGISASGNIVAGNVSATNLSGNLTSGTQSNITGLGTLNSLTVNGNISGSNISAQSISVAGNVTTGNILPSANVTYNLGSPTQQWKSLYISGNTIYIGTTNISTSGNSLFFGNNAVVIANTPVTGDIITSGNISAAGNVLATHLYGEGGNLSNITGANVNGTVATANIATTAYNVTGSNVSGTVANASVAGTVTTNAQPNITSVGTLTSLNVNGIISATGNIHNEGNILSNGIISTTGNVTGLYFFGNGSQLSGIASSYGNSNVAAYLPTYTGNLNPNNISAAGNILGSYILGNGAFLTGLPASYSNTNVASYLAIYTGNLSAGNINVTGNITGSNLNIVDISVSGNIIANTISTIGNITAPYFVGNLIGNISGNITVPGSNTQIIYNNNGQANASPGLTFNFSSNALVSTGTVTGSNFLTGGIVSAAGNIIGSRFIGSGINLSSITAANIVGNVAIANYAHVAGTANTVTTNAQPNITSVGTLTSLTVTANTNTGNLITAGIVSATGNISTAGYFLGNFQGNISGNITVPGSNTQLLYNNNGNAGASAGLTFNAGTNALIATGTISGSNFLTAGIVSAAGNIIGNYYIGNGAALSNIFGANVTGTVANATYAVAAGTAETVTTNAQPNITSVGILSSLSVSGTATPGNLTTAGIVSATGNISTAGYFLGNFQGNISGNITVPGSNTQLLYNNNGNAGASAGLTFNAGTNALVSTGTISGSNFLTAGYFSAAGNVYANEFIGAGNALSNVQGANVSGTVANATYALSAGSAVGSAATVTTNAQPNITSVGTLTSLTVTANTNTGNLLTTGVISSTGNIIAGSGNYFIGNFLGNISGNLQAPGTNTQVLFNNSGNAGANAGFTFNAGTGVVSVTGNVNSGNINTSGTISAGGNITAGNISITNLTGTSVSVTGIITAGQFAGAGNTLSNIQGANITGAVATANTATTVTGNAQANITSVGILTSLSVTGNINPGNLITAGIVSATGNISTAGYFLGNFQGNISGNITVPGANTQVIYNNNGQANASAGFTFNAGTNALAVTGNTTSGNLLSTGTISAAGNILGGNVNATAHTGTTVSVSGNVIASQFIGSGNTLSNIQGANVSGVVANATVAATITSNAQPNITSVGVLTSLSVTGNVTTGNLSTSGNVTANLFVGTFQGNITGNLTVPGSNTQVIYNANGNAGASAGFTFNAATNAISVAGSATLGNVLTGGVVSATGNITGNYILGNGSQLTGITATYGNANVANYLPTFSGNLTAGNISASGSILSGGYLSSTGNIYAAGLVSTGGTGSISGTGNIYGGNLFSAGTISAVGNVTANLFVGNFQGNISGNITVPGSNTQVIYNANGNAGASAGFTFNAGTNALAVTGNTTSGNLLSTGTISAAGNILGGNVNATAHTGTTVSVSGNVIASQFIGSGNTLSNIQGANVSGVVANATVAATITSNAQPNITSVGVLTSLSVTGNVTTGNLSTSGNVTGNYFIGNGSLLTGISGGGGSNISNGTSNVTIIANANITVGVAGTSNVVVFASTGEYVSGLISATGNITGNYIISNSASLTYQANAFGWVSNAAIAPTANTSYNLGTSTLWWNNLYAVNINSANTIATNVISAVGNVYGNSFISTGGGAGSISGSGNITGGNLFSTGVISTAGNVYGGNIINAGLSQNRMYTVATLPAAATAGTGARAFVSDSNGTTFYNNVAAGGSNTVPVFSDGVSWRIG